MKHSELWIVVASGSALIALGAITMLLGSRPAHAPGGAGMASAVVAVPPPAPSPPPEVDYVEVVSSCNQDWSGQCVSAHTTPSTTSPSVLRLRTGVVLEVATTTYGGPDGSAWYQVVFGEWIRYPERVGTSWYIQADEVRHFTAPIIPDTASTTASTTKRIVIDRSDQMLYAYDGDELFMQSPVSTGLDLTPTPKGTFTVYHKTPTRYMQGPLPGISDQYYDLPGVPWDLYFTAQGGAIHGAYWHNHFGQEWSHGCVNLPLDAAHKLYDWTPVGATVVVQE